MALLIAIGSLTAGVIIGVVATYRFSSTSPVKVRQLEQQIEDLQQTHKAYRENVSTHFSTTAELIQQMTESYKEVYHHLASGAQTLCDHEVADKMLPAGERDRLFSEDVPATEEAGESDTDTAGSASNPTPPRDYADRTAGGGALSEDYGLGKSRESAESASSAGASAAESAAEAAAESAAAEGDTRQHGETPATTEDSGTATTDEQGDTPDRRSDSADTGNGTDTGSGTESGKDSPEKGSGYKG